MLKKFEKISPQFKKVLAIGMCMLVCSMMFVVSCSAVDPTVADLDPAAAATQVYDTIHSSLNFTTVLGVLAVALGGALAMFLGWWAIRKVTRMVMAAFSKGKVDVG